MVTHDMNVTAPPIESLRPFVPAKDLDLSKRFYQRLGFTITQEFGDGSGCILSLGQSSFILQKFYVKEHAHNFMMQLVVPNIDAWWEHIEAAKLKESFGVQEPRPPQMQPWGIVVSYVFDPTGVLWHVVPAMS
jgi:catechol 2,3-dioxygenase-like lactoylglutathione lyase family enzyme